MNSFGLWLPCGSVDFWATVGVPLGDSKIYTQEGNVYTMPAIRCRYDAERYCDLVLSIGEHPFSVQMHPQEYSALRDTLFVLTTPLDVKPKKCECGSTKAKLPFHSSWCPLSS